jgi:hypothetical protein
MTNIPDVMDWQRHKFFVDHYAYHWRGYTIHLWPDEPYAELYKDGVIGRIADDTSGDVLRLAQIAHEMEADHA